MVPLSIFIDQLLHSFRTIKRLRKGVLGAEPPLFMQPQEIQKTLCPYMKFI